MKKEWNPFFQIDLSKHIPQLVWTWPIPNNDFDFNEKRLNNWPGSGRDSSDGDDEKFNLGLKFCSLQNPIFFVANHYICYVAYQTGAITCRLVPFSNIRRILEKFCFTPIFSLSFVFNPCVGFDLISHEYLIDTGSKVWIRKG